ncbi:unnamed protein product [Vitrella brassicaformis CCMP3155]|uniref:Uncharacterized protein n=1 Tax=Vitrella brassicaformis (strain CCMP3155) TaxID=1169540 RepID=A0A0G4ECL0_VITBC|nr:unnamed protein product [Vitrella brassicaformis CCMP3155]|eukprot:CEL93041.1 unnamed protein product [Vitrella brassicaformis CCMP3155]
MATPHTETTSRQHPADGDHHHPHPHGETHPPPTTTVPSEREEHPSVDLAHPSSRLTSRLVSVPGSSPYAYPFASSDREGLEEGQLEHTRSERTETFDDDTMSIKSQHKRMRSELGDVPELHNWDERHSAREQRRIENYIKMIQASESKADHRGATSPTGQTESGSSGAAVGGKKERGVKRKDMDKDKDKDKDSKPGKRGAGAKGEGKVAGGATEEGEKHVRRRGRPPKERVVDETTPLAEALKSGRRSAVSPQQAQAKAKAAGKAKHSEPRIAPSDAMPPQHHPPAMAPPLPTNPSAAPTSEDEDRQSYAFSPSAASHHAPLLHPRPIPIPGQHPVVTLPPAANVVTMIADVAPPNTTEDKEKEQAKAKGEGDVPMQPVVVVPSQPSPSPLAMRVLDPAKEVDRRILARRDKKERRAKERAAKAQELQQKKLMREAAKAKAAEEEQSKGQQGEGEGEGEKPDGNTGKEEGEI